MSDLLTQLQNYGEHLDRSCQALADHHEETAGHTAEVELVSGPAPLPRRHFLQWSAAAAVAAGLGSTVWLLRRPGTPSSIGDAGNRTPLLGPTDTTLGRWVVLDDSSDALSVPFGISASGAGNSLDVARIVASLDGILVVGSQTIDGVTSPVIWTSPDGATWERSTLSNAQWTVAVDVLQRMDGQVVVAGVAADTADTTVPSVWSGPNSSALAPAEFDRTVPLPSSLAGLVELDGEVVLLAGAVDPAGRLPRWRSRDGATWADTTSVVDLGAGVTFGRPVAAGNEVIAPVFAGGTNGVARSMNAGATWVMSPLPSDLTPAGTTVVSTPDGFVVCGVEQTADSSAQSENFQSPVPVGTSRLAAWTSEDGSSWTRRSIVGEPVGTFQFLNAGAVWGAAGIVGLATELRDGRYVTLQVSSPDGVSWAVEELDLVGSPHAILSLENGYLAIGAREMPSPSPSSVPSADDQSRNLAVWFRRDR